jgi:ABC-type branched-subunit amino acid transport system ATPase component
MKYCVLPSRTKPPRTGKDCVYLVVDNWDDYSYRTSFYMYVHDTSSSLIDIGAVKIAFVGQTTEIATTDLLPKMFDAQLDGVYSLGQSYEYYHRLASLKGQSGLKVLAILGDIVANPKSIEGLLKEPALSKSLLRDSSLSVVKGQFTRALEGKPKLTDYKFKFNRPKSSKAGSIDLHFSVKASSKPSTNIHALIGRNGVGKTTILNEMIEAITNRGASPCRFCDSSDFIELEIPSDYFSKLVSVSFSAFDPFMPPRHQPDPSRGTCYSYIGLKNIDDPGSHHTLANLHRKVAGSLIRCFENPNKTGLWRNAIETLGSDNIFASVGLAELLRIYKEMRSDLSRNSAQGQVELESQFGVTALPVTEILSSGHAVVLLIITSLIATVDEKTLVIIDEPESHLHPPLLSAFIRALSDLLHDLNGVAIIATHSPVVLQEIPRSCVWKIYRSGQSVSANRPSVETFGENVGMLTSEVFGLEVESSGFHNLLAASVATGDTYSEIIATYDNQLGFEGRAILGALIAERDRSVNNDET